MRAHALVDRVDAIPARVDPRSALAEDVAILRTVPELATLAESCERQAAVKLQRARIFRRDGGRCRYCWVPLTADEKGGWHLDHVMPRSLGGHDGDSNLVLACPTCNHAKSNQPPFLCECGNLGWHRADVHCRCEAPEIKTDCPLVIAMAVVDAGATK